MDICHKVQKINRFFQIFTLAFCFWVNTPVSAQSGTMSTAWSFTTFAYANLSSIADHREIYIANTHGAFAVFANYQMKPRYD